MLPEDSVAQTICFRSEALTDFCRQLLTRSAVPTEHAQLVSDSLVAANLRGVDSHGIQMLVPYLQQLTGGSGVRAQAMHVDGTLLQDFWIEQRPRALHVLSAPSPAATASLAIAREIVKRLP